MKITIKSKSFKDNDSSQGIDEVEIQQVDEDTFFLSCMIPDEEDKSCTNMSMIDLTREELVSSLQKMIKDKLKEYKKNDENKSSDTPWDIDKIKKNKKD